MTKDAREMTLALLQARAADATICPSEVARALIDEGGPQASSPDWRGVMPVVHAAVDQLVIEGIVRLSWKRKALPERSGPYRIGRA